jgi:UDPglucose--hexose-1-phosphate uridylyltransferase
MAKKPKNPAAGSSASEIRKHYFLDSYVIIAPGRAHRPDAPTGHGEDHLTEKPGGSGIEDALAIIEIPGPDGNWAVKVVTNKFPAVSPEWPKAFGYHEIVVDTPAHSTEFSSLPIWHIELILQAYRRRITSLLQLNTINYVSVFKNDGRSAGASLNHSHSQIVALPLIPPAIQAEANGAQAHRSQHEGNCPWCDAIAWELNQKVRIIYEDNYIVAFAPYASRAGYEAWILPRHHRHRLADLKPDETHSLAVVLKLITSHLDSIQLSYNLILQDALPDTDDHFSIKIQPRWSLWAGFELGTDIIINTIAPEAAAIWYKS